MKVGDGAFDRTSWRRILISSISSGKSILSRKFQNLVRVLFVLLCYFQMLEYFERKANLLPSVLQSYQHAISGLVNSRKWRNLKDDWAKQRMCLNQHPLSSSPNLETEHFRL